MQHIPNVPANSPLYGVVTISEAVKHWGKSRGAILMACRLAQLNARQDEAGIWLIEIASLDARWSRADGVPKKAKKASWSEMKPVEQG